MKLSRSKLIVIIPSAIGALVFLSALCGLFGMLFGSPSEHLRKAQAVKAARNGVESYFHEKYGEYPEITAIEPQWKRSGYIIPTERYFTGYVTLKEKNCTIYYYSETNSFYDSKQYDDICSALTEKYFTDEKLGTEVSADIDMCFSRYWDHGDHEEAKCTNIYFDGDINKFIRSLPCDDSYISYYYSLSADIYYSGKSETDRACRKLISDKLDELYAEFPDGSFSINIKNTESSFEIPTDFSGINSYYRMPAEYGTLIARGTRGTDGENELFYTEWCSLDEYVSMADITSEDPPKSSDFVYRTDSSYDGKNISSDKVNVTLTGDAYTFQNLNSKHIFIRLDRKKFSAANSNVPVILSSGDTVIPHYIGRPPVGAPHLYTRSDSWYIFDENYIYIYVYDTQATIMFPQLKQDGRNGR